MAILRQSQSSMDDDDAVILQQCNDLLKNVTMSSNIKMIMTW